MIKSQLIDDIAHKIPSLNDKDISQAVNSLIDQMSHTLEDGDRIEIRGFGSFSLHYRPPRNAHNPKTGVRLMTDPKYTPHFKPGKEMRERINEHKELPIKDEDDTEE